MVGCWLNRAMQDKRACGEAGHRAFNAVAPGSHVPRALDGRFPAVAMSGIRHFSVGAQGSAGASRQSFPPSQYGLKRPSERA